MSNEFTAEADILWKAIPQQYQERLINNVWCAHCLDVTKITDFKGYVAEGDLILAGSCAKCGGDVARVIEHE